MDYINKHPNDSVSLFKIAPGEWDTPLDKVYLLFGSAINRNSTVEEQVQMESAALAGILLYMALEESSEMWICTKTPVTKRDFEVNAYFLRGRLCGTP